MAVNSRRNKNDRTGDREGECMRHRTDVFFYLSFFSIILLSYLVHARNDFQVALHVLYYFILITLLRY